MAKLPKCPIQGKICFPDQDAVIRRILICSRKRGDALRPYYHDACRSWHMSSKKEYVR